MQLFKETYLSVYEPVMLQKGFIRKGVIFHRIVNKKIIQMLSYTEFSYSFTIQFCICPLCAGHEYTTFMDDTRLGSLLGNETYAEWDFDETDCIVQMQESLAMCEEYLFTYFESICDYDSYLKNMFDMYKKMYGDKGEFSLMISNALYEVGLQTGRYDIAKKSREAIIKQNEDALKESYDPTSPWIERIAKNAMNISK